MPIGRLHHQFVSHQYIIPHILYLSCWCHRVFYKIFLTAENTGLLFGVTYATRQPFHGHMIISSASESHEEQIRHLDYRHAMRDDELCMINLFNHSISGEQKRLFGNFERFFDGCTEQCNYS